MQKSKVLVIWSNYYETLAEQQLESCVQLLKRSHYDYVIETVNAGTYEIPAVIKHYHHYQPFEGYIPLSLLLKGETDQYEFIWEHIKECFIRFTMEGLAIGNGIISAPAMALLKSRVENGERVKEAFNAVDYLIKLKKKMLNNTP
jgi:6,7-dimethyl-8-ribityllumazine synthase